LIAGRRFTLFSLGAVMALALALPASGMAAAGDPDTTFSGDGQLTTGFGTTPFHPADSGNAAARLSTGEVYVAGESGGDFALIRFTAAGVLDTTFGGGDGIVITDISGAGSDDQAFAVSVDTGTGNVVVAGQTGNNETADFALVRYTNSGALDPAFGGDGIVTTDFPAAVEDVALAVTTLPGGGVIAAGFTDTNPDGDIDANDFALAAYTSSGTLDPSFDGDTGTGNGLVTTDFGSDDDFANAALLTTAGSKIVVAGSTDPATVDSGDFAIARYSASTGVLDTSFDGDGKNTVSFVETAGNGDAAYGLATDSSSRILVTGFAGPSNGDCAVARLDGTSGALDNTFSTDGKQVVSTPSSPPTLNTQDLCLSVLVQADGKIVLAGNEGSANGRFLLMRLDGTTGTPDPAFDSDGILITDFGGDVFPGAAAVFADEGASKLVAAGTGDDNFAAARYAMSNGALDGTYGVGGKAEADVPHAVQSSETARGVAVQPDGKIVVAGPTNVDSITQVGGDQQFGLARYNPDGTLDAGFGAGGIDGNGAVSTNFDLEPNGGGTTDSPAAVALQSDGKIVVVGKTDPVGPDPGDFAIARYEADGDLDPTFDTDGLVTTDLGGAQGDLATSVAIVGTPGSPGFRIVVAGTKQLSSFDSDFAVEVYEEDGDPDPTFNGTGTATTDFGALDQANAVATQADGSIVAVGVRQDFSNSDFALARYQSDGDPDLTFDTDGKLTTDIAGHGDVAYGVAIRELGAGEVRIIASGQAGGSDGALAAYKTDGSPDGGFAGDGELTIDLSSSFDALRGVANQPDGKVVASGTVESPDFGLARLTPEGALDPGFGGDGLVSTSFPNPSLEQRSAFGMALQPDGKVVAVGGGFSPFNGSDFLVARYGTNPPPPTTTPPAQQPPATPSTPKKKCKQKKKHRAASAKKCKKKKK
jgi:uncharacterized delta-60 repeat protein